MYGTNVQKILDTVHYPRYIRYDVSPRGAHCSLHMIIITTDSLSSSSLLLRKFSRLYESPQNSRRHMGDMQQAKFRLPPRYR